jgi:hypothetical protein
MLDLSVFKRSWNIEVNHVTLERYTLRWTGTARPPGFSGGWPRTHNQPATPASNSRPPGVFPRCHQPKQVLSSVLCGPAKRTPVRAACMNARDLMRQAWHSSASVSNQTGCIWLGVLLARAVGPGLALVGRRCGELGERPTPGGDPAGSDVVA